MQTTKVQTSIEPKRRINNYLAAAAGAAVGAGATYVLPTKKEAGSLLNKDAFDTFVSSGARKARTADRSVLKYASIGALAAVAINVLAKAFSPKPQPDTSIKYSKYDAIIDASDYACMVTWYGDKED